MRGGFGSCSLCEGLLECRAGPFPTPEPPEMTLCSSTVTCEGNLLRRHIIDNCCRARTWTSTLTRLTSEGDEQEIGAFWCTSFWICIIKESDCVPCWSCTLISGYSIIIFVLLASITRSFFLEARVLCAHLIYVRSTGQKRQKPKFTGCISVS